MPEYRVSLTHSFLVTIHCNSAEEAARLTEGFVTYSDGSSSAEREKYKFSIEEIELTYNDAFEVEKIEE
jgi:hypothetical protein